MDDKDLEAIKQQRMQQMQQTGAASSGNNRQQQQDMMKQREEMKNMMLTQVLSQEARARLNTIAVAKPDKAKQIEGIIMQMAQYGQIQGKLDEEAFVRVLKQVNEKTQSTSKVKFDRRRAALDSDDDGDY